MTATSQPRPLLLTYKPRHPQPTTSLLGALPADIVAIIAKHCDRPTVGRMAQLTSFSGALVRPRLIALAKAFPREMEDAEALWYGFEQCQEGLESVYSCRLICIPCDDDDEDDRHTSCRFVLRAVSDGTIPRDISKHIHDGGHPRAARHLMDVRRWARDISYYRPRGITSFTRWREY